jgi:hypothetical protein
MARAMMARSASPGRQHVGLGVVEVLQAVLDAAQEVVGGGQLGHRLGGRMPLLGQQPQHLQRRLDLQRRSRPPRISWNTWAMNSISRMPPGPSLTLSALSFFATSWRICACSSRMALMAPKSRYLRKTKGRRIASSSSQRARRQRPRLDPGVALPLAALGDEVVFQHVEGTDQRAGIAVGPQAHVDAEHLAVLGDVGDGVDQGAAQAGEVFEIGNRSGAIGVAVLGIDEDQVDVRRDIELAPAQLAHADHDQLLRPAIGTARRAVAFGQPLADHLHRLATASSAISVMHSTTSPSGARPARSRVAMRA